MRVYFVRHGESVSNAGVDLQNIGAGGDALTELGWKQAGQLGQRLAGQKFSRIYVSAMRRAQETAAAIAEHVDAPIRFFPEIHEIVRTSREYQDRTVENRLRHFIEYFDRMAELPPDAPIEDGESFNEITGRGRRLLDALLADEPADGSVLVVSHGGFLRFLLGISIFGDGFSPQHVTPFMKIGTINTGISEFELSRERFRLITWMDQAHL